MDDTTVTVGVCRLGRRDLEKWRADGHRMRVRVTGMLVIAGDVDPALAAEAIGSIQLRGPLMASRPVRRALADRVGGL
jgi:hypothetical protein